jgi:penicillin amidase
MAGFMLLIPVLLGLRCLPPYPVDPDTLELPGLEGQVQVTTDTRGVPHVFAGSLLDALRVQGYLHARDRFFQMDVSRRTASGTLAELTGDFIVDLSTDVAMRPLGLRAAAQRDADLLTAGDEALLEAYADGVNAWLASNPLPPEYAELEISSVPPWEILDTLVMAKGQAAELNLRRIELQGTDLLAQFEAAGVAQGFDGKALFLEEVAGMIPLHPAATVPDAGGAAPLAASSATRPSRVAAAAAAAARRARERAERSSRVASRKPSAPGGLGSNAWGVAASKSASGSPMVAGDGHMSLPAPALGYEIHLAVEGDPVVGDLNLSGSSIPGIPTIVIVGQSGHLAWASTNLRADSTDFFLDRLVRGDPSCPARLCIESAGEMHPVEERSETYRLNWIDGVPDNPVDVTASQPPEAVNVLSVPFRSFGPIRDVEDRSVVDDPGTSPAETTALTLQYAGFHGFETVRAQREMLTAENVHEFGEAVRLFGNVGNWIVADTEGNLAYFTSGEIPLRADLEAGVVLGDGPRFIRDGSGPSNWVPDPLWAQGQRVPPYSQGQTIPFLAIPSDEMPHIVNPPAGFVVNANNDPLGLQLDGDLLNQFRPSSPGSIYFLGGDVDGGTHLGLRAGRITQLLREKIDAGEPISLDDMKRFQGDTALLDAQLLTPPLLDAFENAGRVGAPQELASLAQDPEIGEAIGRLAAWDFSSPTGIPEGYDAADLDGVRDPVVTAEEAAHSVAATLYTIWRGHLVDDVVNDRLVDFGLPGIFWAAENLIHQLVSEEPFTGVGAASGVDFFPEPAALPAADRRDAVLLGALRDALDGLASNRYAAAFGNSTNQDDYRWGKLHRVTFEHRLGGARSIPPASGFTDLAANLPGIARDGGFGTVNVGSGWALNAKGSNAFRFSLGAWQRNVMSPSHQLAPWDGVIGFASLPGGSSGDATSPLYASQLAKWLTVDYHYVPMNRMSVYLVGERQEIFTPPLP